MTRTNRKSDRAREAALQARGWRTGSVREFLGLSDAEAAYIELKLVLARALRVERERHGLTQAVAARQLRSSQSRVAKMEAADRTVSLDLLVRSYFGLGGTRAGMARAVGRSRSSH